MSSKVTVSVAGNVVSVDTDKLHMAGKGGNAPIEWEMTTAGWTFPSNGIVIEGNDGQFTELQPHDQGRKFKCVDKNDDGRTYKYDVNVTDGKVTLTLDPTIENESR
jgi:hypothetical protein